MKGKRLKPLPDTVLDRVIPNAEDPNPIRPSHVVCRHQSYLRSRLPSHCTAIYLLRGVLSLFLADWGDPELSGSSSPGLTRIFHLAVFLTSSLIPGCVPCNLLAISLAFCSPNLLVRRESERGGASGLAGALVGAVRAGLSAADTGIGG